MERNSSLQISCILNNRLIWHLKLRSNQYSFRTKVIISLLPLQVEEKLETSTLVTCLSDLLTMHLFLCIFVSPAGKSGSNCLHVSLQTHLHLSDAASAWPRGQADLHGSSVPAPHGHCGVREWASAFLFISPQFTLLPSGFCLSYLISSMRYIVECSHIHRPPKPVLLDIFCTHVYITHIS